VPAGLVQSGVGSVAVVGRWRIGYLAPLVVLSSCRDVNAAPQWLAATSGPVPALSLPAPTGVHRVGRLMLVWNEVVRHRVLPVWLYYPTAATDSTTQRLLPDSVWAVLHRDELASRLGMPAAAALAALRTTAVAGAPVEATGRRLPLLIFAPDHGRLPTDYSAIIEELASRGYVVVAFAPPGDGGVIRFADGTVMPASSEASCSRVADDLEFVRQRLAALDREPAWALAGTLDLQHVAVAGAGSGGSAALLAAAADPEIAAAVSLDGDFVDGGRSHAHQPLLYLSTEPPGFDSVPAPQWARFDRSERRRTEMWQEAGSQASSAVHVQVAGMYRGNLTDAAMVPPDALPATLHQTRVGSIPTQRGYLLVASVVAAFLHDQLVGSRTGMMGAQVAFPEITVTR
jgi:dienelactone hydrolase